MNEFNYVYSYDDMKKPSEEDEKTDKTAVEKILFSGGNLIQEMEGLIQITECCGFTDKFINRIAQPVIKVVAEHLQLTLVQTVLLMPFVSMSEDFLNHKSLARYYKCEMTKLFGIDDDLLVLVRRGYLKRCEHFGREGNYILSEDAKKSFGKNEPLPIITKNGLSPQDFINELRQLFVESLYEHNLSTSDLLSDALFLIKENPQLKLVQALKEYDLDDGSILILLYYCKRLVFDYQREVPLQYVSRLFDDFYGHGRSLERGDHILVRKEILEPCASDRTGIKDVFMLTDEARDKLLSEYDIIESEGAEANSNLFTFIKASEIKEKPMFFSSSNQKEIDILADLLSPKHYNEIRTNLIERNMRLGFNCLFYGTPGTGKTETVLQLARATGRDIMQVDISSIRDMWYGNTEKMAREIFTNYAAMVKRHAVTPILLFNEADALLSIRTQIGNGHSTDKTENTLQNIFLQEMENLDGIMIATTNLTENLDKAFERRFIYKVKFEKPSIEARTSIWKSMIPELTDTEAETLASQFDFSGGQIENIARKSIVETLLFSKKLTLERLIELCENESLDNNTQRRAMGFGTGNNR